MSPLDLIWGIVLLLDFRRRTYWGMSTQYWQCFVVCHPSTENVAIHQNLRVLHLCWYDDLSSWLYKSQQVNLSSQLDKTCQVITCQVIRRGARGQNDKSTCQVNMTSWLVCRVELVTAIRTCHLQKKLPASAGQKKLRIASASEQVFARFSSHFLACSSLSKMSFFRMDKMWNMTVTWPPTHIFSTVQTVTNILLTGTTELTKHGNEDDQIWWCFLILTKIHR